MKTKEILAKLKYNEGTFPREAIMAAIENRDLIIPELLDILEYSTNNIESLIEEKKYIVHIYAMYLLAQFREKRAYELLVKFFSIPGEISLDFTGDVVTEDLGRIFASVCGGDDRLLKSLIENKNINEYVRTAALSALLALVVAGEKSREEVISYFKELFNGKLEREFSHTWNALVIRSCYLHPEELYEEIERAFNDGLVEAFSIDLESVKDDLKKDKESVLRKLENNRRFHLIDDTVREMEKWACFERPKSKKEDVFPFDVPTVTKKKKVGRNEPCPCGSGKKYKKCCLNKA